MTMDHGYLLNYLLYLHESEYLNTKWIKPSQYEFLTDSNYMDCL